MSDQKQMGYIPVNKIHVPEVKLRVAKLNSAEFEELVTSVSKDGILQVLQIRPYYRAPEIGPDGEVGEPVLVEDEYWLVDGLQRFTAAKSIGMAEVPCVLANDSDYDALRKMLISNQVGVQTTRSEKCSAMLLLLSEDPLTTIDSLAADMGLSVATCKNILSLDKLGQVDEKIIEAVDSGEIISANAYALTKLPKSQIPEYVDSAKTDDATTFAGKIQEQKKANNKAAKTGAAEGVVEYKVTPKGQTWATIYNEASHFADLENDNQQPSVLEDVFAKDFDRVLTEDDKELIGQCFLWLANMHPSEVARKTEEHEAKVKAREEKKARDKAAKEAAKAAKEADKQEVSFASL